jgi:proteasome lid subunit RPN8/RPN11
MTDDFFDGDWKLKEVRGSNGKDVDVDVSVSFSGFTVSESGRTDPSTEPSTPTSGPTAPTTPTGAFGFPENDERFMQSLEVRGKNGHDEIVETVYALVLTEGQPPRLVALDDPEMYLGATRRSVRYYIEPMAKEVARQCRTTPDAVVKVHTHPNGSTKPSDKDKQGTEATRRAFEDELGSGSFEFLQGIHAHKSATVSPDRMREPTAAGNSVSWNGERFRHTLALFDGHFRNAQEVQLV